MDGWKMFGGVSGNHRYGLIQHLKPTLKTMGNHKGILSKLIEMLLFETLKEDGTAGANKLPFFPYKIQPYIAIPVPGRKRECHL